MNTFSHDEMKEYIRWKCVGYVWNDDTAAWKYYRLMGYSCKQYLLIYIVAGSW